MSGPSQTDRAIGGDTPRVTKNSDLATRSGNVLYETAQELECEQQVLLESAPLEQSYQETLAGYVHAKHDQVERIEDRLDNLIEQQRARLQQVFAARPGLLSRGSTKAAWQAQQMQQQARLQSLHGRLEAVREIKDSMGIHGPRIEELATRRLRMKEPGLANDFDDMQEAQRRHQALLRKQKQEKKLKQQQDNQQQLGRGQRLSMSQLH